MKKITIVLFLLIALVGALAQVTPLVSWNSGVIGYCSVPGYPSVPVSGSQLWFSADCITFSGGTCSTPSNGSTVTAWDDRSGNARGATRNAGTATFNTAQINGLPALSVSSSQFNIGGTAIANSGAHTAFAVFNLSSVAAANTFFGALFTAFQYRISSPKQQIVSTGNAVVATASTSLTTGLWHQGTAQYTSTGPAGLFHLDTNTDSVSGGLGTAGMHPPVVLFYNAQNGGEWLTGSVAELIYYNTILSSSDIKSTECYLYGKYGI